MSRIHNFSAGPAVLPVGVLQSAQEALLDLNGSGLGLLECSHRSALFDGVINHARDHLRALLSLSDDQEILFLQGGASSQFFMVPMNLMNGGRATYLDTGRWSEFAELEARRFGPTDVPYSSKSSGWDRVPRQGEWGELPAGTRYVHYTSNNTVAGTAFDYIPDVDAPLVCDMSSNILSAPIDGSRFDLIYAGAQKNMGPSGVTVVVIRRGLLERCERELPSMLRYDVHVDKGSMKNTPNTFGIFLIGQVCTWIEQLGGLGRVHERNLAQAKALYDIIDGSDFWTGKAQSDSRSLMNITWTTGDSELDTRFWKQAADEGLSGLKGHRVVGGLRASIYNAQTDEAITALADYMRNFERTHG